MVALVSGAATTAAAQEPDATTREAAMREGPGREGQRPASVRPEQVRSAARQGRDRSGRRGTALASVLRERVLGWRLHTRRRFRATREPVQLVRRARQLYDHGVQAGRSRVQRPSFVPPPRIDVAPRRLARGDTSRFLWNRDGHLDRQSHELFLPTAVRRGNPHVLANTTSTDVAWWPGAVRVGAAARRG